MSFFRNYRYSYSTASPLPCVDAVAAVVVAAVVVGATASLSQLLLLPMSSNISCTSLSAVAPMTPTAVGAAADVFTPLGIVVVVGGGGTLATGAAAAAA